MRDRLTVSLGGALAVLVILLIGMVITQLTIEIIGPVWFSVALVTALLSFLVIYIVEVLTDEK